jgi:hypothetical protein
MNISKLAVALAIVGVGAVSATAYEVGSLYPDSQQNAASAIAAVPQPVGDLFARTELYFGTDKPGPDISEAQFRRFVAEVVTPRFPDGLTILSAIGQFREDDGDIIREDSKVIVLLYPAAVAGDANQRIEEIRGLYQTQFQQQSVLRVDSQEHVSF